MGVEEGLLVGWKGAGGMGSVAWGWVKDADQRLRRREVTMQAPRPWMPQRASEGKACRPVFPRCRTYPHTGPVHWVPYNQGRPGRHGSPLPGGLTTATLSGGGGLYLEPGVPTRPASV